MPSDPESILRMFAVRRKGPGGTDSGTLEVLLGTAAFTVGSEGFVAGPTLVLVSILCTECEFGFAFCCRIGRGAGAGGSSSRSSMEKSRSCVESGGADSATGDGRVMVSNFVVRDVRSAESSRAICVPLSRKSSHPSRTCAGGTVG